MKTDSIKGAEFPVGYWGTSVRDAPMIALRMARGIRQHFTIRISEWIMIHPALGMWFALTAQPEMFKLSPSFSELQRWGTEEQWALVVLFCGLVRLLSLTINGTFDGFRYSPHLRLIAALVGIAFWSQFTLGFFVSAINDGGAYSSVVAYSTLCLAELANIYRANKDVSESWKLRSKR